jgi:type IV pilus assembly protein PilM
MYFRFTAGLLLAMGISTIGSASVLQSWSEKKWDDSQKYVKSVQGEIGTQKTAFDGELAAHKTTLDNIAQLVAPLEKRSMWMELFKAVNECLPSEEGNALDETDIMKQKKIRLTSITTRKVTDVAEWHKKFVDAGQTELFAVPDQTAPAAAPGYIVTLRGFHFYNHKDLPFEATDRRFVESAFVSNLRKWTLDAGGVDVPVGQLGISYPIVAYCLKSPMQYDPNQPTSGMMTGGGMMGGGMMDGMLGGSGADGGDLASSGGVGMPPGMSGGAGMMSGAGMRSGMGPPGMAGGAAMGPPGMGSGAGMMGPGKRGAPGAGGEGTSNDPNQLSGAQGPIFQQQEQKQLQVLDRSDFVVQFIWTPTVDRDRKPEDPRVTADATAGGGDAGAAHTDPAAAPAAAQ